MKTFQKTVILMSIEKKIAAHYLKTYNKIKKSFNFHQFQDISYDSTVFLTITKLKILLGIGGIPIPSIGIKLPGPKKTSLETLIEAAEMFGYEYVLAENNRYRSENLFNPNTEEIDNFKQIKISETISELPESTIFYISDPKSNIGSDFTGDISYNIYTRNYSNAIINPKKKESILFFVIGGKSSIKNIEEIYRRYYGNELSNKIIALRDLKINPNRLYSTAVEQVERTKEQDRTDQLKKPYDKGKNKILKNLFKETKNRTTIKEISEFINAAAEKIRDNDRLENRTISYTNKEKSMLFITEKNTKKDTQNKTTLYVNNIAYESKFDLLKNLSKGAGEYTLEFEPILLSKFSEIIESKRPFANYIDAALKAVTIQYRTKSTDINITFKNFENNSFKDHIKTKKEDSKLEKVIFANYKRIGLLSEMEIISNDIDYREKQ